MARIGVISNRQACAGTTVGRPKDGSALCVGSYGPRLAFFYRWFQIHCKLVSFLRLVAASLGSSLSP